MDYNQLLSNAVNGNYNFNQNLIQKTPKQIAEEQKIQAYQSFIQSKEGVDAIQELNLKFDNWYNENYGVKPIMPSKEVIELKEIVEKMAKQIEGLTNQLK